MKIAAKAPTPGAMRAAHELLLKMGWAQRSGIHPVELEPVAAVIDRETVAPELLAALEALGVLPIGDAGMRHGYCFCFNKRRDASQPEEWHTGECRAARAAIQKAKGAE